MNYATSACIENTDSLSRAGREENHESEPKDDTWFEVQESADNSPRLRNPQNADLIGVKRRDVSVPRWKKDFEDFPFQLESMEEISYCGSSTKYYVLNDSDDQNRAVDTLMCAKELIREAQSICSEIPNHRFSFVYLKPHRTDPISCNYMTMRFSPYTKTNRKSKFPALLHAKYYDGLSNIEINLHLLGDGKPGKMEAILRSQTTFPMWSIYARNEGGELHVNRIVRSDQNGDMVTLFTKGR